MEPGAFRGGRIRRGGTVLREGERRPRRGRPPLGQGPKIQQSLRLSQEVLDYFRGTGDGWQARIDAVLLAHVRGARFGAGEA